MRLVERPSEVLERSLALLFTPKFAKIKLLHLSLPALRTIEAKFLSECTNLQRLILMVPDEFQRFGDQLLRINAEQLEVYLPDDQLERGRALFPPPLRGHLHFFSTNAL